MGHSEQDTPSLPKIKDLSRNIDFNKTMFNLSTGKLEIK